jgi:hypothetical protein
MVDMVYYHPGNFRCYFSARERAKPQDITGFDAAWERGTKRCPGVQVFVGLHISNCLEIGMFCSRILSEGADVCTPFERC